MILKAQKILFYLPSFEAGGAERQALNLATILKEQHGIDVVLAAQYGGGPIEKECDQKSIRCLVIPFDFYYFKFHKIDSLSLSKLKAHFHFLKLKKNLIRSIASENPDFIFSYCYEPNVIAGFFNSYYKKIKVVWNQRDVGTPQLKKNAVEAKAIENTFKIVGNSRAAVNYLESCCDDIQFKLSRIPNGIALNNEDHYYSRLDFGLAETDAVIGMIANYADTKNHLTLVKAYNELKEERFKLLLVGKFSEADAHLLQHFSKKKIIFHYEKSSITSVIKLCDVMVHPSLSEGMPNAVLESMYCDTLIIASDIEPHREVLGDTYPFLFSAMNVHKLSTLILEACNREHQEQIAQNKRRVLENFSIDKLAQSYLELLHG